MVISDWLQRRARVEELEARIVLTTIQTSSAICLDRPKTAFNVASGRHPPEDKKRSHRDRPLSVRKLLVNTAERRTIMIRRVPSCHPGKRSL